MKKQRFTEIPSIRRDAQGRAELYQASAARSQVPLDEEEAEEMDVLPQNPGEILTLAERDLEARRAQYQHELRVFAQELAQQRRLVTKGGDEEPAVDTMEKRLRILTGASEPRPAPPAHAVRPAQALVDRCVAQGEDALAAPQRCALMALFDAHQLLAMAMARQLVLYSALLDETFCVLVVHDSLQQRVVASVVVHLGTLYIEK